MTSGGWRSVSCDSPETDHKHLEVLFFFCFFFTNSGSQSVTSRSESVAALAVEAAVVVDAIVPLHLLVLQAVSKGVGTLVWQHKHRQKIVVVGFFFNHRGTVQFTFLQA